MTLRQRLLGYTLVGALLVGGALRSVECYQTYAIDGFLACIGPIMMKEDTEYAPGYSHAMFRAIKLGMTPDEVLTLLGPPLEKYRLDETQELWSWSRSRRDHSYRVRRVFLERGQVTKVVNQFYVD